MVYPTFFPNPENSTSYPSTQSNKPQPKAPSELFQAHCSIVHTPRVPHHDFAKVGHLRVPVEWAGLSEVPSWSREMCEITRKWFDHYDVEGRRLPSPHWKWVLHKLKTLFIFGNSVYFFLLVGIILRFLRGCSEMMQVLVYA